MTKIDDALSLRAVGGSHLFKSLDEEGLALLLKQATNTSYSEGQVVVREGDPGEAMYLLQEGQVRVYTCKGDNQIELAVLGAGACVGEVALLTGTPRTATVEAIEPCKVLCFHKSQIDEILRAYPKVRKLLNAVILGRARDTMDKITAPTAPVAGKPPSKD